MTIWCEGCGVHHEWEINSLVREDPVARAHRFMKRRGYEINKCNVHWQTLFSDLIREFKEIEGSK